MINKTGFIRTPTLASLHNVLDQATKHIYVKKIYNNLDYKHCNKNTMLKLVFGFTIVELLITLAIISLISAIVFNSISNFRKNQALIMDTDTVVEILRQARNQTLTSKNSSVYGVHFDSPNIIIFTGAVYSSSSSANINFVLSSTDTILSVNLAGGGSDVIFERLTGETDQFGTVVISSPQISEIKTVTIYRTGLVEQ